MSQLLSASLGQGEGTDREKKKPRRFSKYSTSTKDLIVATASANTPGARMTANQKIACGSMHVEIEIGGDIGL